MFNLVKQSVGPVVKRYFSVASSMGSGENMIRTAVLQLSVGKYLTDNLKNAENCISEAAKNGAQLIILPECFNSPYGIKFFNEYAERLSEGPTSEMLSKAAKSNSIYLVGGTFPEREGTKLYNTCTVWGPDGELITKYRKMHLFDIDIPGGVTFKESEVLEAGSELATFCMNDVTIGIGVCYDLRFEEFAKLYRLQNCEMIIYPAAFTITTGPMHFELLQRARALDNQIFVITASPARAERGYIAWGHSQVTSPWGKVLAQASYLQEILYCNLDLKLCEEVRQQIPIFHQRRSDIYNTVIKTD